MKQTLYSDKILLKTYVYKYINAIKTYITLLHPFIHSTLTNPTSSLLCFFPTFPQVGGATGLIGDPTGRVTERVLLDEEKVRENVEGIRKTLNQFLHPSNEDLTMVPGGEMEPILGAEQDYIPATASSSSPSSSSSSLPTSSLPPSTGVEVVNNVDWYQDMSIVKFLREAGRHMRVNTMLGRESVKRRMTSGEDGSSVEGLSLAEFFYQALQGYDFYHLHQTKGCTVQLGGTDQWGNVAAGIDLIHRMHAQNNTSQSNPSTNIPRSKSNTSQENLNHAAGSSSSGIDDESVGNGGRGEAHALTLQLLLTSTGEKFGKSAGNAVWLREDKTSPFALYQHLLRTHDADVERMLMLFTFLSIDAIKALMTTHSTRPESRVAQRRLAEEVVTLAHGPRGLAKARAATRILYPEGSERGLALEREGSNLKVGQVLLSADDLIQALDGVPQVTVSREEVVGKSVVDFAVLSKLCSSKGDARRLISGGGFSLGNARVTSPTEVISLERDVWCDRVILLRSGTKKQHVIVLKD